MRRRRRNPASKFADFDLRSEMEDGYTICDTRGGYTLSRHGRHVGKLDEVNHALLWIAADMEKSQYWPNVFLINDHGNVDLIALKVKRNAQKEITDLSYKIIHSWT